jgi:hypothetical protein
MEMMPKEFKPGWEYMCSEPLSLVDAVIALVQDGETLYDKDGWAVFWNKHKKEFVLNNGEISIAHKWLTGLCRRPEKRKRLMTNDEAIAWASGSESLGWMVRYTRGPWMFPRSYEFTKTIREYQRARMLPDLSGIDESTIQGFEVEEVE